MLGRLRRKKSEACQSAVIDTRRNALLRFTLFRLTNRNVWTLKSKLCGGPAEPGSALVHDAYPR